MLPLDKLSDKALKILEKNGLSENDIAVCLSLDLDLDGNFSDDFLCVSADK